MRPGMSGFIKAGPNSANYAGQGETTLLILRKWMIFAALGNLGICDMFKAFDFMIV